MMKAVKEVEHQQNCSSVSTSYLFVYHTPSAFIARDYSTYSSYEEANFSDYIVTSTGRKEEWAIMYSSVEDLQSRLYLMIKWWCSSVVLASG